MILPCISAQLLNLIPDPVLMLERMQNVAVMANSQFVKLTAYTQTELAGMPIAKLVEGVDPSEMSSGEERLVNLTRRSKTPIKMKMSCSQADTPGQYLMLCFKTPDTLEESKTHPEILHMFTELTGLLSREDYAGALEETSRMIAKICGAGFSAIYLAESARPFLKRVAAYPSDSLLPLELPASDLSQLNESATWVPGRRLHTELYKSARACGLEYLSSAPIGDHQGDRHSAGGLVGLVVVSDTDREPSNNLLDLLGLASSLITVMYANRIKLDELSNELQSQSELLILRNGQMNHQKEGVIVIAPDLSILEINPAAEWMLEYTPEEVRGQPIQNILIGTKSLLPALHEACGGIPTHNLGDISLHRRSGQSFPAQVRIIPVQAVYKDVIESENHVIGILVFIFDVSERQQIQERTQQLEHRALLGEVIAVFAHEVRNPINNIATGLQLMESRFESGVDPDENGKQIQLVQRMLGDCQRLNNLMESVLQFSRPIEPKLEAFDMLPFLQRFLDRWRPRLARVNVVPYLNAEDHLPLVIGDPRTLEQVFTNLISNAVHAMSNSGGTLAIRLMSNLTIANYPQVEITVSDTGPGIPEEFRERLFEPFVTSSASGTGLGLAITKRIITAHRGSIWLESFPGGTVFHIMLPAETLSGGE